jgi:methylmalonyl-CoA mutase cobalamin-binding domain/chain
MPRPRIGAGADDTNAECVCCHGWFILVLAAIGMARAAYSSIAIAGFDVNFMGPDVETSRIINAVKQDKPQLLGLSALLTNTMDVMPVIIKQLEKEGLRNSLKVIIGGAPVSQDFADLIGADGFAYDAAAAVPVAKKLVS